MFVTFVLSAHGKKESKMTLSHWIKETICFAYSGQDLHWRGEDQGRSTRGKAASRAELLSVPLEEICRGGTWASKHTFVKHCL